MEDVLELEVLTQDTELSLSMLNEDIGVRTLRSVRSRTVSKPSTNQASIGIIGNEGVAAPEKMVEAKIAPSRPFRGGKSIKMMENSPGSPALSVASVSSHVSKRSAKADSDSNKVKKSSGKKSKSSSAKQSRTKPCTSKVSMFADPTSTSNLGQVAPEIYVVEKIVGKKVVEKVPYYYIKWKGWGTVHNTWEPVENLDGCADLLEKYEKSEAEKKANRNRNRRKGNGKSPSEGGSSIRDDDEDDDLDVIYEPTDEMKKSREQVVEFGVLNQWQSDRIPVEMRGVLEMDGRLTYLIRCQTDQPEPGPQETPPPLSDKNAVLIRACGFRSLFPHLVISFYEGRLMWRDMEDEEDLEAKVAKLMNEINSNEINSIVAKQEDLRNNSKIEGVNDIVKGEPPEINDIKAGVNPDEEKMEVDVDSDEDDIPKIFIRKGEDLFGLPESVSSSDESSSEDEFQMIE